MPAPYPLQLELHANRHITRWRPLVQWLLAIPHLPEGIRGFGVSAYRYALRVEAYVGFLTDRYPPFSLAA
jgi:hypothetical protein